jgi:hypothetical protein
MNNVRVAHREATDWSDWVALGTVRFFRWGMDWVTGYKHPQPGQEISEKFKMTEQKWLTRFIFLESVAGVPGMVGGMLRHLRSLRRMKRDNGWYVAQRVNPGLERYTNILLFPTGSRLSSKKHSTSECTCSPSSNWPSQAGSCV